MVTHEDGEATELDKAKEVCRVILMTRKDSTKVLQPSEQSLDLPTLPVSAQCPAVLGNGSYTVGLMRGNNGDSLLCHLGIELVAVVGLVPDQSLRGIGEKPALDSTLDKVTSCGEADATCMATGRPWRSATAMIFVPLPRLVFPTQSPLFSPLRKCRR